MYFFLTFFFSYGYTLGYDKFYFIPQLDETHVNDTMISVFKLNTCFLYDESTSYKYIYYNDTHVQGKSFQGENCQESNLKNTKLITINTYLTHIQDQIDQSYMYSVSYTSTTCNEPYSYVFYNNKHCNICGEQRSYISNDENDIFMYLYGVELGKDLKCEFNDEIQYGIAQTMTNNKCTINSDYQWEGLEWKINSEKQEHCENATDEMGILLAFIFLMLILI